MEGDLPWCFGSSNNWDLHAVVRLACGSGGRITPPPASDKSFFSWLPPQPQPQPQMDAAACRPLPADPAVEDLCLQALLAAAPKPETQQPAASPRNEAPPKPLTSCRNAGGPTRSRRK